MTDKTPPCGLSEADENDFRVLLTKIREHDPDYMAYLVVTTLTFTQPPNSLIQQSTFDDDEILTNFVLIAKGTTAASRLSRLFDQYQRENR